MDGGDGRDGFYDLAVYLGWGVCILRVSYTSRQIGCQVQVYFTGGFISTIQRRLLNWLTMVLLFLDLACRPFWGEVMIIRYAPMSV